MGKLPIHQFLQQLGLKYFPWDFDAVGSNPNALNDEKSVYPRIETGFAFTLDLNDELVEKFIIQSFKQ